MTSLRAPLKDSASPSPPDCLAGDSARRLVREATRTDHELLDAAMSNLELDDRAGYGVFLKIHHTALNSLARQWRAQDHPEFTGLACCVVDDLQALGNPVEHPAPSAGVRLDSLHPWGIAYVIRGSRLGAKVLARRVPAAFPKSYLDSTLKLAWPDFLKQLDEAAGIAPHEINQIVLGAKLGFAAFIAAASECGVLR